MMKRSTNGSVYEVPASKEHNMPVSKIPAETKVTWHADPATTFVGPREEEARRKSPEMKFLYAISACLTLMVLWGIFREVHLFVPKLLYGRASVQPQDTYTIDQSNSNANALQVDSASEALGAFGGRKAVKHLLEVHAQQFLGKHPLRVRTPLKVWDKQEEKTVSGSGGIEEHLREAPA